MYENLFGLLASASKLPCDRRIDQALSLTTQELNARVGAIWRYNSISGHCSCFARSGYSGDLNNSAEFVLKFDGSLIEEIVHRLQTERLPSLALDLTIPETRKRHWAPEAIADLELSTVIAIPFYNFALPEPEFRERIRGVVFYYFVAKGESLGEAISKFLTATFSDLYSALYLMKKDEVTDQVINTFVEKSPPDATSDLLETVCRTTCVDAIGVEACSIYEWSALHSGFRLAATTGLSDAPSDKNVVDRKGDGLVSLVAQRRKSVLIENCLSRDEIERILGARINPEILFKSPEITKNPLSSVMFVPVFNPAAPNEGLPSAIIKFVNKKHRMVPFVDFFDLEDRFLAEEIGRMIALYEEQSRALRLQEAFALQFGHEARAPAVGIRGTADRIIFRLNNKTNVEVGEILALAQDIFDFSEIMISFAESLNFGFGDRSISRQLRYRFRQTRLEKCVESAQKVVIPICREEGIHFSNIRFFGTFPLVFVDNRAFMQVFYNLMTNAIKYRVRNKPEEFMVQISSRVVHEPEGLSGQQYLERPLHRIWNSMKDGGYIRQGVHIIDFSDFGMGVLEDEVTKIFAEGFRSPRVSSQEIRGSGVGLTIVRNILADFDSLVWVESAKEPTTFRIMIPDLLESSQYARRDKARSWRNG